MTVLLLPSQLADIERQTLGWPECDDCHLGRVWVQTSPDNMDDVGPCPNRCSHGRIPQPLYIVGEGRADPATFSYLHGILHPPAGWPAVGERVKCEPLILKGVNRCGAPRHSGDELCLRRTSPGERCVHHRDVVREGSTLPRVELTVTCPICSIPQDGRIRLGLELCQRCKPGHWEFCSACQQTGDDDWTIEGHPGSVPWGSALWQTLPVVRDIHQCSDQPHLVVADGEILGCVNTFTGPYQLDPALVRPGSFVAILTEMEMAA